MPSEYIKKPIYRMVHIDNVEYVLKNGMCTRDHKLADPHYINIGDRELISQRVDFAVRSVPPGGTLGDYVPFYFAGHSPMLLNISTGWRGITKRPQQDIVFIVSSIRRILEHCPEWCFTDGHAKHNISSFYNNVDDLDKLDWDTIKLRHWGGGRTYNEIDRQRKKASEFLVKNYVPVKCIWKIYVFNEASRVQIQALVDNLDLEIPVNIDNDKNLYFP